MKQQTRNKIDRERSRKAKSQQKREKRLERRKAKALGIADQNQTLSAITYET